jgi:hypothetical protein
MRSDFKVKIFPKKLSAFNSFGPGVVFWV